MEALGRVETIGLIPGNQPLHETRGGARGVRLRDPAEVEAAYFQSRDAAPPLISRPEQNPRRSRRRATRGDKYQTEYRYRINYDPPRAAYATPPGLILSGNHAFDRSRCSSARWRSQTRSEYEPRGSTPIPRSSRKSGSCANGGPGITTAPSQLGLLGTSRTVGLCGPSASCAIHM